MFLFYFVYVIFFLYQKLFHLNHMMSLLVFGVMTVCQCSMFFLAGRDIQTQRMKSSSDPADSFGILMCRKALLLFFFYILLGVPSLYVFRHQDIYLSVRNIIAFNIVPGLCGVLVSLAFLYLLSGLTAPYLEQIRKKKLAAVILSLSGFLMVFLPDKILGYALTGIFIGGDNFSCVPIATHLIAFFWGFTTAAPGRLTLKNRWNLMTLAALFICGGAFAVIHQLEAFFLCAGTAASFIAVLVLSLFRPLGEGLRHAAVRLIFLSKESVLLLDDNIETRVLDRRNTKRYLLYFLLYTVMFVITAFFIFLPIMQLKQSLVWKGDAMSQYIPNLYRFLQYVPRIIKSMLHGNFDIPQYDYSSGLGSTVFLSHDPLYWLFLLLPKKNIDVVYTFMTLFRYYLTGLSFSLMLFYFRRSFLSSCTASLAYTFSGYAVFAGTRHYSFISTLILLPLMVVAMERLIRHKKWYMFTILVTVSLLCSYYFLYMDTIALGIYFVVRILSEKEYRNFRTFFGRGLIIVGSYLLGVSMGIITLATSFGSYLNSDRSSGNKVSALISGFKLYYRQSWLSDMFLSSISYIFTPGSWLKIGTVPLAIFGAVLLFTKKNRRDIRLLFCLFTSFCFLPVAAFIFGGFSTVTNRWSYIYSVLTCFLIALCLDQMHTLTRKDIYALTGITVYYVLLVYFDSRMQFTSMYAGAAFLALTLCLILMENAKGIHIPPHTGKILVGGITILALIFNGSHLVNQRNDEGELTIAYTNFDSLEKLSASSLRDLKKLPSYNKSDDFFRSTNIKGSGTSDNSSIIIGHNDISIFSSTLNKSVVDYNRMMGNCGWTLVRITDYNFRTIMNELASVRYIGFTSDKLEGVMPYGYKKIYTTKDGLPIYENQFPLPLGYTYDTVIADSAAAAEPVIRRQEETLHAAVIDDDYLKDCSNLKQKMEAPLSSHEIPYEIKYDGIKVEDNRLKVEKPGGSMTFTFKSDPNSETYVVYSADIQKINNSPGENKKVFISQGDDTYGYTFRTDAYKTGVTDYVFNLGYHKKPIHSCKLTFKSAGSLDFGSVSVYSQPMDQYEEAVSARSEDVLNNISIDNNTITGDISLDKDKMLVIGLPYQNGWKAYVDDKEVPIYRANYQYMGLNLTSGSHKIRLHYSTPGLKYALLITIGGIAVFFVIIVFNIIRKRRKMSAQVK